MKNHKTPHLPPFSLRATIVWPLIGWLPFLPWLAHAQGVYGLPAGGRVTAGSATIQPQGADALRIQQSTDRAIFKWTDFSIGQGRSVVFVQPGAGSAALNIVTGSGTSNIAGTLQSNGSVVLVNQNGIAITPTGLVDTRGGFIASTLGIAENDFMNGRLSFFGAGGSVTNAGRILTGPGGTVGLLGSTVSNEGVISAPLGRVALGSGQAATLDLSGDGFLQVMLPADATSADGRPLVSNSGVIQAAGGSVMLKAATVREAMRNAVHMPGEIQARSVSGHDGAIVLDGGAGGTVTVGGRLDVSADAGGGARQGGRIDITGDTVQLQGAQLDATGVDRGGLVRVGGAFQGGAAQQAGSAQAQAFVERFGAVPALASARNTSVDAASRIDVSASGAQGTGGTAVLWSDGRTAAAGSIAATGAGAAGAVELSSRGTVAGLALDRVALGKGGRLLLDPQNIEITDATNNTDPTVTVVSQTGLKNQLSAQTDVSLQASNDINWQNAFFFVNGRGGNLSLSAGRSISLDGAFNTGGGNWTLIANDSTAHVVDAERLDGYATLDLLNARFISNSIGNGSMVLKLDNGGTHTYRNADGIRLGALNVDNLTATVVPDPVNGLGSTRIIVGSSLTMPGTLQLTGNLLISNQSTTLQAGRIDWTDERTGATMRGEGGEIRFIEGGQAGAPLVLTRYGRVNGSDAVRLQMGGTALTRTYGDTDDSAANGQATATVAAHSTAQPSDDLATLFTAGSVSVAGPGVTAGVGSYTANVSGTANFGLNANGYFVDLTGRDATLAITPRPLTVTAAGGNYTYGSPQGVVTLGNIANNDAVAPVATLNGNGGVTMSANATGLGTLPAGSAGYGFAGTLRAGTASYTVSGLGGTGAGNYTLDVSGLAAQNVVVTPKPINYTGFTSSQAYGQQALPSPTLVGVINADQVAGVQVVTADAGNTVAAGGSGLRPVGNYRVDFGGLTGTGAGNYTLASSGNTAQQVAVTPKNLQYAVTGDVRSTYGTAATGLPTPVLSGVENGDGITGQLGVFDATTAAGTYALGAVSLAGAGAGNYRIATTGNQDAQLTVGRKTLNYIGSSSSQVYGSFTLPSPQLVGVVNGDAVAPGAQQVSSFVYAGPGESNAPVVGDYTVNLTSITGAAAGNYTLASTGNIPSTVAVTPRPINFTLSGGSTNTVYGTAATAPTLTLGSAVGADVVGGTVAALAGDGTANAPVARLAAGGYTWGVGSLTGQGAGNYRVAATGNTVATLTVAQRPVTWTVASGTAVYGDSLSNPTTFTSVLAGDEVLGNLSAYDAGGAPVARPQAGNSYAVRVASLGGASAGNYLAATTGNTPGSVSVSQRPVTYSVADVSTVYGTAATVGAATLANGIAGDNLGATVQVFDANGASVALAPRTAAGNYRESVTALANPNYRIASTGNSDGTLAVSPLAVRFSTPDTTTVYGTPPSFLTGTLSGVLAGDDAVAGATTTTVPYRVEYTQAGRFADLLRVGGITGLTAGNYVLSDTGSRFGSLTVQPKALNYSIGILDTGNQTVPGRLVYGQLNPDFYRLGDLGVATLSGLIPDDRFAVQLGTVAPSVPRSSGGQYQVGSYTWTAGALTGRAAANYVLAPTGNSNGVLTIVPRELTVVFNNSGFQYSPSVEYGQTANDRLGSSFQGLLGGDRVGVTPGLVTPQGTVALPDRLAVGTYNFATVGPTTGADAANYTLRGLGQTYTVTPRPLVFNIGSANTVYGQAITLPTATLGGVLDGDLVAPLPTRVLDGSGAPFVPQADTAAGVYATNLAGVTGRDASNYMLFGPGQYSQPANDISRNGVFSIARKALGYSAAPGSLTQVYGTAVPLPTLTGVLFNDDVQATATATPYANQAGSTAARDLRTSPLLDAQVYDFKAALVGGKAGNYSIDGNVGQIVIQRKPVTLSSPLVDRSTVYGDLLAAQSPSYVGLLPGADVQATHVVYAAGGSRDNPVAYGARTDAGNYYETVYATGSQRLNYATPEPVAGLTITQRPLQLSTVGLPTSVYGSTVGVVASQTGMLPGDLAYLRILASYDGGNNAEYLGYAGNEYTYRGNNLPGTGSHTLNFQPVQVDGPQAGNYKIGTPVPAPVTFSVTPKTIFYSVDNASNQYGYYLNCAAGQACNPYTKGGALGAAHLDGVFAYDAPNVQPGPVQLLDLLGRPGTLDATTPVGNYLQVIGGIGGAKAGNYMLATTGNRPGTFTVNPLYVSYAVTSGAYLPGYGLVGEAGKATLTYLADGRPVPGDVQAIVVARDASGTPLTDFTKLKVGRYTVAVEALAGADAGNYRVIPSNINLGGFRSSTGNFDVYADATLGLAFTTLAPVPKVPPVVPQVTARTPNDVTPTELPGSGFGRYDFVTGTDGAVVLGATSGYATGAAGGNSTASTKVGDVELSANAGGLVTALASYGVTGVSVSATAGGHVDVALRSGPGYVMVGAQADSSATVTGNRTGVQVSANVMAGASASGGAGGNIGIGTGTSDTTVSTFVYARTDNQFTFKDGKLVNKVEEAVGVGASAATSLGVSGSVGSADAGVVVYSPGSLGIKAGVSGGYSNGTVSLSLDLGAQIGIFGAGVHLNVSIDFVSLGHKLGDNSTVNAITSFFGFKFNGSGSLDSAAQGLVHGTSAELMNDPAGRIAYLTSNNAWLNFYKDNPVDRNSPQFYAFNRNLDFYQKANSVQARSEALLTREIGYQQQLFALIKTGDAVALQAFMQSDEVSAMKREEAAIQGDAKAIGLKLAMDDGKIKLVNNK